MRVPAAQGKLCRPGDGCLVMMMATIQLCLFKRPFVGRNCLGGLALVLGGWRARARAGGGGDGRGEGEGEFGLFDGV